MITAGRFAIAFCIAILFPMLVAGGVSLIQPYPKFDHHVVVAVRMTPTTPEGWQAWDEENRVEAKQRQQEVDAEDRATRPFYWLLVCVATPLGIAAMLTGSHLKMASVGIGLIFGGMLTVADGYSGYWEHLDNWTRCLLLLLALATLLFVAHQRFAAARNPLA